MEQIRENKELNEAIMKFQEAIEKVIEQFKKILNEVFNIVNEYMQSLLKINLKKINKCTMIYRRTKSKRIKKKQIKLIEKIFT